MLFLKVLFIGVVFAQAMSAVKVNCPHTYRRDKCKTCNGGGCSVCDHQKELCSKCKQPATKTVEINI